MTASLRLANGVLVRGSRILLVASRYPNQPAPLWHLPGGRPLPGESLAAALAREFAEETSLAVTVGGLRYASESYDRATGTHVLGVIFDVAADGEPRLPDGDAHVVDLAWVERADLAARISVDVVREPLLASLAGDPRRYYFQADAGITIAFAEPH